jgi:hypothetical protein
MRRFKACFAQSPRHIRRFVARTIRMHDHATTAGRQRLEHRAADARRTAPRHQGDGLLAAEYIGPLRHP